MGTSFGPILGPFLETSREASKQWFRSHVRVLTHIPYLVHGEVWSRLVHFGTSQKTPFWDPNLEVSEDPKSMDFTIFRNMAFLSTSAFWDTQYPVLPILRARENIHLGYTTCSSPPIRDITTSGSGQTSGSGETSGWTDLVRGQRLWYYLETTRCGLHASHTMYLYTVCLQACSRHARSV